MVPPNYNGPLIKNALVYELETYHGWTALRPIMAGGATPENLAKATALTKKIKVRFDFGEGELFIPAVLSADITGDGRQDLLVQRDEEMLLVYPGEATERLFSKQPIRLELNLPKDRESFVVADLDGDGRDELIVHLKQEERSTLSVFRFDA